MVSCFLTARRSWVCVGFLQVFQFPANSKTLGLFSIQCPWPGGLPGNWSWSSSHAPSGWVKCRVPISLCCVLYVYVYWQSCWAKARVINIPWSCYVFFTVSQQLDKTLYQGQQKILCSAAVPPDYRAAFSPGWNSLIHPQHYAGGKKNEKIAFIFRIKKITTVHRNNQVSCWWSRLLM